MMNKKIEIGAGRPRWQCTVHLCVLYRSPHVIARRPRGPARTPPRRTTVNAQASSHNAQLFHTDAMRIGQHRAECTLNTVLECKSTIRNRMRRITTIFIWIQALCLWSRSRW